MRTTKSKRILSAILAICLVFGSAAALPKSTFTDTTNVIASAESEQPEGQGQQEGGEKVEDGFRYVVEDGAAVIVGMEGEQPTLAIPATLAGLKVKAIGEGAFRENRNMRQVTIAEGIEELRGGCFEQCGSLTSVTLPKSLKLIGEHAFERCEKLASIDLKNVVSIKNGAFN